MVITDRKYLQQYSERIGNEISTLIRGFDFSESKGDFDYLTKASAVYSSNIEGNSIDLNSFMNYELSKEKFTVGKEIEEIENLISAYKFAQQNELTESNLLNCHKTLSETFLIKSKRGDYRVELVGVFGKSGMAYLAIEPKFVQNEVKLLFEQIEELLENGLTEEEVFYFASMVHLRAAHIHPFQDGNGRVSRLLEKWFIAQALGREFWKIPSEEYYKVNQQEYYKAIHLGENYYELKYDNCLDSLEMLPKCLETV